MHGVYNVLTAPYESLNRLGRRTRAALERRMVATRRKEKAAREMYRYSEARRAGLEGRLDAVRARTAARKGRCNNPRFRTV